MQATSNSDHRTTKQQVTSSGAWMIACSLTGRISRLASRLALVYLLVPKQLGVIALAEGLTAMVSLVQQFGLADVLVNRYRKFHLWNSAGMALSYILGLCTFVILLVLAVASAYIYDDSLLGWVIAAMAIAAPMNAIGIVPLAKLRGEMKFRQLAIVQSLGLVLDATCTILFAWLGFGVFCVVCAIIVEAIFRNTRLLLITGITLPKKWSFRKVKFLLGDSMNVYTQSFFNGLISKGDYLLLGLFVSKGIVGLYSIAYTLSVQAISLIALNLTAVLFSAFNTIVDAPERLTSMFMRSSKLLAFTCAPICILQAVIAEPLILRFLKPDWHGIVPLVHVLCVGTAFRCASFSWEAMLKSQRKFALVARFSVFAAIGFLIFVTAGCYYDGAMGCAIACAVYNAIVSPLQIFFALGSVRGVWKQVLDLSTRSLGIAIFSFGGAWLLAGPARESGLLLAEASVELIIGGALYLGLSMKLNPAPLEDLVDVVTQIIRRKQTPAKSPSSI